MKTIFKTGDRVFDYIKGWGEIVHTYSDNWEEVDDNYTVCVVKFDSSEEIIHFTKYLATKMLSFTEYTLQGFTQEKPVNYEEYVGKWGKFWDSDKDILLIGKLLAYDNTENEGYPFENEFGYYANFEPLTEEQIKALGLCD
jgi:hypothetical protein|nr:MAG TPA: hypothetical protein [Caudoviricetes sp.]